MDPSTLYPTTLPEGLNDYSGKSLRELRLEVQEMEQKLVQYRAAAGLYAWSYYEKLLQLSNAEVDRSTEDSPDEIAPPTREVKTEALLDTLVWATHRLGGVSKALSQISEAATKICDSASGLGPAMTDQTKYGSEAIRRVTGSDGACQGQWRQCRTHPCSPAAALEKHRERDMAGFGLR